MTNYNERIAALESALSSGTTEVTIGEQTIKYRSISEIISALNYLKSERNNSIYSSCDSKMLGGSIQAVAGRGIRQ